MDIAGLLKTAKNELRHLVDNPVLEAEILLAFVIGKSREYLLAHPMETVTLVHQKHFQSLVNRRSAHEPIAQIVGEKEFYGLSFIINDKVLIPRPETELLVDKVLARLKTCTSGVFVDIGTGSGCIAISVAKNLSSNISVYALDISSNALDIAQQNASKHHVAIEFIHSDLLSNLPDNICTNGQSLILAANLPYISTEDILPPDVHSFEPSLALFAGKKGMNAYEALFRQIIAKKLDFKSLIFEFDPRQQDDFRDLAQLFPAKSLSFYKDYCGLVRIGEIC